MGPDQTRRMRAGKFIKRDLSQRMAAKLAAAGLANVHFSGRQASQNGQPGIKGFTLRQDNGLRICAERVGVDGRNENGSRGGIRNR